MGLIGRIKKVGEGAVKAAEAFKQEVNGEEPEKEMTYGSRTWDGYVSVKTRYNQDIVSTLQSPMVAGIVKSPEGSLAPFCVVDQANRLVGYLTEYQVEKLRQPIGEWITAYVMPPELPGETYEVIIPLSEEALEEQRLKDSLKLWFNVDQSKWEGPDDERQVYKGGEILVVQSGNAKPQYVIIGGGLKLVTVNSRMKSYNDIEQRVGHPIRKVIAELKSGDYGYYWHVGLYY